MTHVTRSKVLATLLFGCSSFFTESVLATAPQKLASAPAGVAALSILKSDSAEFCTSIDRRLEIIRDFGTKESYVVIASANGSSKPVIRSGFTYVKQPGGTIQKNEVSFEMFELMVEPFDNEPRDQAQWAKTFEELYAGNVAIIDDKGKTIVTIPVTCHAAVVDFK